MIETDQLAGVCGGNRIVVNLRVVVSTQVPRVRSDWTQSGYLHRLEALGRKLNR